MRATTSQETAMLDSFGLNSVRAHAVSNQRNKRDGSQIWSARKYNGQWCVGSLTAWMSVPSPTELEDQLDSDGTPDSRDIAHETQGNDW
jgi:hypothetical protein